MYLVVGWEFHGRHTVNVLLDLGEQVIPATDDTTFVLIVHQLQFIALPYISHLQWPEKDYYHFLIMFISNYKRKEIQTVYNVRYQYVPTYFTMFLFC